MRRSLALIVLLLMGFAPAPFPKVPKPMAATEVVVQLVDGIDRITVTFGTKKVLVKPDERWQENLAACLYRFRKVNPAPRRLILRFEALDLSPNQYISLLRICRLAGYPEIRREEERPSR